MIKAMDRTRTILALLTILTSLAAASCGRQAPEYVIVEPVGEFLEMPISEAGLPPARFFTFKFEGRNVNLFVRKDRDGEIRTHFDACYSCFKYKMGYVVEANQVVCRACRIGYDLDEPVWDFVGPCVPISLSNKSSGTVLRIKRRDLERGAQFF